MGFDELPIKRLVLLDDDRVFLRTLTRAMEARGYAVSAFWSRAAIDAAIETGLVADFAVLDLRLEDGNGLEVIPRLKRSHPGMRIVVLTGYGNVETAVAAAKLGISDYLAKPADADAIEAALQGRPREMVAQQRFLRPDEQEFYYLLTIYERHDRNMSETARAIGMHRRTLQRILRRHGIAPMERTNPEPVSDRRRLLRLYRLWTRLLSGSAPPLSTFAARDERVG